MPSLNPQWPSSVAAATLPARSGLGLKPEHFREILASHPDLGFFEIHAENYLVDGGPFHHFLTRIRTDYPLSVHGVGLSIGGEGALDAGHLRRLRALIDRYQPASFSEHLAWSSHGHQYLNDLLPLPYTDATLARVCRHIDHVQDALGRPMLLENPATYVTFADSTLSEPEFLGAVVRRTGCGLLLDVNNVYVSCINHGWNIDHYVDHLPLNAVVEIHLAGFAEAVDDDGGRLLIDSHSAPVADAVWQLYHQVLQRIGPRPTLLERDADLPALSVLLAECAQAEQALTHSAANHTRCCA